MEIDPATGDLKQSVLLPNANPGMIDLVAAGRMVYALSPGTVGEGKANVVVVDVGGERIRQVQVFELGGVGSSAQGLAVLV